MIISSITSKCEQSKRLLIFFLLPGKNFTSYNSVNKQHYYGGMSMYKNLYMVMNYATFMKWMLVAMASGAMTVGSWWLMDKWVKAYEDARKDGAVA